jgi:putative Mn2+ efflux pump MntP
MGGNAEVSSPLHRHDCTTALSTYVLIGIAVSLAMDAFAVAVAASVSLGQVYPRQAFRLSFHFGLFQALMPLIGWLAGRTVAGTIEAYDHWAAFALLTFVGIRAIRSALKDDGSESAGKDPTRGFTLIGLSVATSLDALAVGLSFSFLQVRIWSAVAVIGLVAALATLIGMTIGSRLGMRFGRIAELVGGLVLILIGMRIVLDHVGIW